MPAVCMVFRPLTFDLDAMMFRDQDSKLFVVIVGGLADVLRPIVYEKLEALDEHC